MREQNKHFYEQNLKWNYDLSSRRSTRGATAHPQLEETCHHHTRSTVINRVCYYRAMLEQRTYGDAGSGTLVLQPEGLILACSSRRGRPRRAAAGDWCS